MKCEEVGAANGTLHISGSEVFSWGFGLLRQQAEACAGQQPSGLGGCGSGPAGIAKHGFGEASLTPSSKVHHPPGPSGALSCPKRGRLTQHLKVSVASKPAPAWVQPGLHFQGPHQCLRALSVPVCLTCTSHIGLPMQVHVSLCSGQVPSSSSPVHRHAETKPQPAVKQEVSGWQLWLHLAGLGDASTPCRSRSMVPATAPPAAVCCWQMTLA